MQDDNKPAYLKPRDAKISIPLPTNDELPSNVVERLKKLPSINNLRMFARVPRCFDTLMDLINELFNQGTFDKKLREYMYLRIAVICNLYYEFRHNRLFAKYLNIPDADMKALQVKGEVTGLDETGNLVCRAAEEITKDITLRDETLKSLLDRFGADTTCELILLVAWFNLLIRYVEATRVPYEKNIEALIKGAQPLKE